jgi:hypothetical protein
VIVANQVEDAMDQQANYLVKQSMSLFCRLPAGGRQRDDNIAKKGTAEPGKPALTQGEGKHVR